MLCMTSPALIYLLTPLIHFTLSSTLLPLATSSFVLFISSGGDCYACVFEDSIRSHRLRAQYHEIAPTPLQIPVKCSKSPGCNNFCRILLQM